MASPIVPFSITAPGFWGLNKQDSSIGLDPQFALDANNCVIDKSGRVASRKGWTAYHSTSAALGANNISAIGELVSNAGVRTILCAGNNKLFKVTAGTPNTLTELTYGGGGLAPTITASNWKMVQINGCMMFWQRSHDCLIFDPALSATEYRRLSEHPLYSGSAPQANTALAAFGRIWVADTATDKNTVYWCDTLSYMKWTGGTSGSLNLYGVWPQGGDEIVTLAEHNDRLFIFGRKQILVYKNVTNPAELELEDSITNTGCVGRDTVVNTPSDVIFLSDLGVASIKRTIQEKSAPIGSISLNVNDDIRDYVANEGSGATIKSTYSPVDNFYLVTFVNSSVTYCFDTRAALENGALRATTWTDITPKSYCYSTGLSKLLIGFNSYIGTHDGYLDNAATYRMTYYGPWIDFGDPIRQSILKKITATINGATNQYTVFKWAFDFGTYASASPAFTTATVSAEYGIAEYNIAEYSGNLTRQVVSTSGTGAGKILQIGFESIINGLPVSIQRVDIFTKNGALK